MILHLSLKVNSLDAWLREASKVQLYSLGTFRGGKIAANQSDWPKEEHRLWDSCIREISRVLSGCGDSLKDMPVKGVVPLGPIDERFHLPKPYFW